MRPVWTMLHPRMTPEHLGYIPWFLDDENEKPAAEQINDNYGHGGGWRSFKGFKHIGDHKLQYPGDPAYVPLAECKLRNETIVFYQHSWVAVFQEDGTFDVARID